MADKASTVAAWQAMLAEVQAIGVIVPPPPPPPQTDLSWFTSKAARSITNIGTATALSINPCPTSSCAWSGVGKFASILAASGSVYVPSLGRAGTIVHTGGGHNDYYGNEVIAFDLYTQLFVLLKPPHAQLYLGPNGYHADSINGELWADAAGSATLPNQPGSGHTYGQVVALPPGFGTSDPLGAMLTTCRPSLTPGGQKNGVHAHAFELSSNKYSRFAGPIPSGIEYSHSFLDVQRRRVVTHTLGGLTALNVDTRAYTKLVSMPSSVYYMVWGHYLAADLYVGLSLVVGGTPFFWIVDPKTNARTSPTIAESWPWPAVQKYGGGYWSELLGGIVYYHGQGEFDLRLVTPPTSGDPRTTPWHVKTIAFSGAAPPPDVLVGAGAHCKRIMEMPQAGGALWFGQANKPVQFWKY